LHGGTITADAGTITGCFYEAPVSPQGRRKIFLNVSQTEEHQNGCGGEKNEVGEEITEQDCFFLK